MFLLIPDTFRAWIAQNKFTFHYVSTYTIPRTENKGELTIYIPLCFYLYQAAVQGHIPEWHLHSTMFLLILSAHPDVAVSVMHLHSTMFLLILLEACRPLFMKLIYIPLCFYLYETAYSTSQKDLHLHSTMFLLIHRQAMQQWIVPSIYIPLCFYLYLRIVR